jgi:hypothetical protein
MKAHYHHAVASTSEDFQKIISHSTLAVSLTKDPQMLKDHETWTSRNDSIHFLTPEPIVCKVYSVQDALEKV